jgi:hypothetical protein
MRSEACVSNDISSGTACDDVATSGWLIAASKELTRVRLWANDMRTRGPIRGHHVSLIVWLNGLCVKFVMARSGFEPVTSISAQVFMNLR